MKEQLYRIHWKALRTGATGHGTGGFPYAVAEEMCEALNEQDRNVYITHWLEAVPTEEAQDETP